MNRRRFLARLGGAAVAVPFASVLGWPTAAGAPALSAGFQLKEVAATAGIHFVHNNGAYGAKLLPETLGSGCAFLDYDRDGWQDILLINGMDWPGHGGARTTMQLYRNNRNGTFTDVTRSAGLDGEMYGMGVAVGDYDNDGWPDLLVANDTQPNKLYRNQHNGTFKDVAVEAGVAFSTEGKARAGMGVAAADFENSGVTGFAITNFDNEMTGLYLPSGKGAYEDIALQAGIGTASLNTLGFGCVFADLNLDGLEDLAVANGHIDQLVRVLNPRVRYAQPPQIFLNEGRGRFTNVAGKVGRDFDQPRVGRGLCYADFDRDGDIDLLMTTNNGPACLFRNDQTEHKNSMRFLLTGTKSNRDAIGATVRIFRSGMAQSEMVKTGSSYLSQSELPLTFGLGESDQVDRLTIEWPSGRTEEYKNVRAGRAYQCTEGKGITPLPRF